MKPLEAVKTNWNHHENTNRIARTKTSLFLSHTHHNHQQNYYQILPGLTQGLIEKVQGHLFPPLTQPEINILIIMICVDVIIIASLENQVFFIRTWAISDLLPQLMVRLTGRLTKDDDSDVDGNRMVMVMAMVLLW